MTIDERVNDLMEHLPYATKSGGVAQFRERLRLALLETARDQRHACAEAVNDIYTGGRSKAKSIRSAVTDFQVEAHQAIMNADCGGTGWIDRIVGTFDDSPVYQAVMDNEKAYRKTLDEQYVEPE